ncbi:unnamed protein product [Boreogadus saida]
MWYENGYKLSRGLRMYQLSRCVCDGGLAMEVLLAARLLRVCVAPVPLFIFAVFCGIETLTLIRVLIRCPMMTVCIRLVKRVF